MKLNNFLQKLRRHVTTRNVLIILLILIVGIIIITSIVRAATSAPANVETEAGTASGNAAVVVDSSASAGSAIKFGTSGGSGGGTGTCPTTKHTVTSGEVSAHTNSGYSAGTQLYVPGSPDPWGGCFPNAGNTGIPSGTTLTPYTGSCNITTANTTITAKTITCDLTIAASNVVIQNSKITTGNIDINSGSFILRDSEVDLGTDINSEGLKGINFTVLRDNMYNGKRQVWCNSNCTVQDSFLHDQLRDPTGVTHESAVRVEQFTTLTHNTILCNAPDIAPDAGCSANQTGYPDFVTIHDNTMQNNLYMATTGGYCSYGGATAGKPYSNDPQNATNIVSRNNVFQRGTNPNDRTTIAITDSRRYTCGYYGVTTAYAALNNGFVFTGNMWDDGLLFSADTTYPYGTFTDGGS